MSGFISKMKDARSSIDAFDSNLIEIDGEKKKELQKAVLSIYKDILRVCQKNEIIPYLIGGSALGAVRHHGFIPWDDDIDIGMTRDDYTKFVSVFDAELGNEYIINAPNLSAKPKTRFTKIYKKGTVCREVTDLKDSLNGIFVDIFVIENIPRNLIRRRVKGILCNILQFISSQVFLYENDNPTLKALYSSSGEENYKFRMRIGRLFSFVNAASWFNAIDRASQYKKTGLYGIVTGRKHYFGEIFEEDIFFPVQYKPFEDIDAPVFNNLDVYLRNLYHDYMQLPPENKRERHYILELRF